MNGPGAQQKPLWASTGVAAAVQLIVGFLAPKSPALAENSNVVTSVVGTVAGLFLSTALAAQVGQPNESAREACAQAAQALVRQRTDWDGGRAFAAGVLRWRTYDGTRGICRVDNRGRVFDVRVEEWGGRDDIVIGPPGGTGGLTEERDLDHRGGDYAESRVRSLSACQTACRRDPRCRAYTYSVRDGLCWLKSQVNPTQVRREMITGRKTGPGEGGSGARLTEEWDYDRPGGDHRSLQSGNLASCQNACRADVSCRAYTFNTSSGTCYLKNRVPSPQGSGGRVSGYKVE